MGNFRRCEPVAGVGVMDVNVMTSPLTLQDLTTYDLTDNASPDDRLTVTAHKAVVDAMEWGETVSVSSDAVAAYCAATFQHTFEITVQAHTDYGAAYCWTIMNPGQSVTGPNYAVGMLLRNMSDVAPSFRLALTRWNTLAEQSDSDYVDLGDVTGSSLYFRVTRTAATGIKAWVYSDAFHAQLLHAFNVSMLAGSTYSRLKAITTAVGSTAGSLSFDLENLSLGL